MAQPSVLSFLRYEVLYLPRWHPLTHPHCAPQLLHRTHQELPGKLLASSLIFSWQETQNRSRQGLLMPPEGQDEGGTPSTGPAGSLADGEQLK